jgi:hypothetical protein
VKSKIIAAANPRSIPLAEKATGLLELPMPRYAVDTTGEVGVAGNDISIDAGTVNCCAATGARQKNDRVILKFPSTAADSPEITTAVFGSPPVHVTVTPCERTTVCVELI